jgi:hypothetical protein
MIPKLEEEVNMVKPGRAISRIVIVIVECVCENKE